MTTEVKTPPTAFNTPEVPLEQVAELEKAGWCVIKKSDYEEMKQQLAEALKPPASIEGTHRLGDIVERDGEKLRRVKVIAGRGNFAYWHRNLPKGEEAGWCVVTDMIDNHMASHRAGKLYEVHEGKPNVETWLVVGS